MNSTRLIKSDILFQRYGDITLVLNSEIRWLSTNKIHAIIKILNGRGI